jgi:hypothetical protein
MHSQALLILLAELYSRDEINAIQDIVIAGVVDIEKFGTFDYALGGPCALTMTAPVGPGTLGIPGQGAGRYTTSDRAVFRPLQYATAHLMMVSSHAEWLARDVVESSSSHVEALVKRIGRLPFLPLGTALKKRAVKSAIPEPTYSQALGFCDVYNAAKHDFDQAKDTHLFSLEDAVAAYFIARRLAIALYPLARLTTDMAVFDVEPATFDTQTGRLLDAAPRTNTPQ